MRTCWPVKHTRVADAFEPQGAHVAPGRASAARRWRVSCKTMSTQRLTRAADQLAAGCERLSFGAPVTHVYNPLKYARAAHRAYLLRYAAPPKRVVFLGMNPGPWGMAQTGVPFGEIAAVRDWLGIEARVGKPPSEHPRRPVQGFACPRSEVSGARLWGLFRARCKTPRRFFAGHLVLNYCPLLFLQARDNGVVNITPDKLRAADARALFALCDEHLREAVAALQPKFLIGVGRFAESRLTRLFDDGDYNIGQILHPSPASPAANRGFAAAATRQLEQLGVWRREAG